MAFISGKQTYAIMLAVAALMMASAAAFAGTAKSGGNYEMLQDSVNARGGSSNGGVYEVISSIGQRTSVAAISGGAYSGASGLLGGMDTTAPTVSITSPTSMQSASGTITLVGAAFDQNDVLWKIYIGGGLDPTSWTEVATGSGNRTSASSFATWDSSRYAGKYTYKIVALDTRGNMAEGTVSFSVDYTLKITGSVPDMKWVFIGLPAAIDNASPISVFGDGEYKVFRWTPDAPSEQYVEQYRYPSVIKPGYGFWFKSYSGQISYNFNAPRTPTSEQYALPLKSGWNQISSPYDAPFNWGAVMVRKGGSTYDLPTAASMGLIYSSFYTYAADGSWVPNGIGSFMTPQTGCYVRAYDDVDLMFDQSARALSRVVRPAEDFRVEVSAAINGRADAHNYFGSANIASDEFDILDAEEPPRSMDDIEGKYVSLYFPKTQWSRNAGKYSADFRPSSVAAGQSESWEFEVNTNDIGGTVTLDWDEAALPADQYSFELTNLENGQKTDMASGSSLSYVASGAGASSVRFRIDATRLTGRVTERRVSLSPGWKLISAPIEPVETSASKQLGDDLPALNLYQFYDGIYYPADRADIQAGLGYWLYLDKETEIDIDGVPSGAEVVVPLKKGWNLIGNPYESVLPWSDSIKLACGGAGKPISEATSAGETDGRLYEYGPDGGYTIAASLEPWKGYFIKLASECDLVMAAPAQ